MMIKDFDESPDVQQSSSRLADSGSKPRKSNMNVGPGQIKKKIKINLEQI